MKRQILLSLAFSALAANAFAMPVAQTHNMLAEGGSDHVIKQDRFTQEGSDRTLNRVAQDGSDRTLERLSQDGSDRTLDRLAQDGSDYVRAQHDS
ncbi:hypothetical protein SFA35_03425 [Pseudomonas sp. HR96]|uniref:hypothetical protein n=1 Tax=Pseudomonas sp. HR96 TaxID=1027966 RepID=UPI002A75F579|nr:hypothetical protein [Pseudomonas sp. HR96]WPP00450.1 hypothetical protein SFA35_03425 [Pseudomonas sp. HR96]